MVGIRIFPASAKSTGRGLLASNFARDVQLKSRRMLGQSLAPNMEAAAVIAKQLQLRAVESLFRKVAGCPKGSRMVGASPRVPAHMAKRPSGFSVDAGCLSAGRASQFRKSAHT